MNQKAKILVLVIWIVMRLDLSNGCGLAMHIEISNRALFQIKGSEIEKLLQKHYQFMAGGSPFADWAYLCPIDGKFNEYAHWPPFIETFIRHINKQTDNHHKEQLITFVMGMVSHMESDVLWHWGLNQFNQTASDYTYQGFIRSLTQLNSDCKDWNVGNEPTCHHIADEGGELYLLSRGMLDQQDKEWKFPLADIIQVYKTMDNGKYKDKINYQQVKECLEFLVVKTRARELVSEYAYQYYSQHSAFLVEQIYDYYDGGIDSMAVQVQNKWQNIIKLINYDQNDYQMNHYKVNQAMKQQKEYLEIVKQPKGRSLMPIEAQIGLQQITQIMDQIMITDIDKYGNLGIKVDIQKAKQNIQVVQQKLLYVQAMALKINPQQFEVMLKQKMGQVRIEQIKTKLQKCKNKLELKDIIRSEYGHSYFGYQALSVDLERNGQMKILISAPGFIEDRKRSGMIFDQFRQKLDIFPMNQYQRLGHKMTKGYLDNDEIEDVIISAPYFGELDTRNKIGEYFIKRYEGRVYLLMGKDQIVVEIQMKQKTNYQSQVIGSEVVFHQYNGIKYLIVGSGLAYGSHGPWQGKVHIFKNIDQKIQQAISSDQVIDIQQADHTLEGQQYSLFGKSIICQDDYLVIGSPGNRNSQNQQATGLVSIYSISQMQLISQINGNIPYSQFGDAMILFGKTLIVGAKSQSNEQKQSGSIYLFSFDDLLKQEQNGLEDQFAEIYGDNDQGRFGSSLSIFKSRLVVSEPFYSEYVNGKKWPERGAIYLINGVEDLKGRVDGGEYEKVVGNIAGGRFGAMLYSDQQHLLVGAPYESYPDFTIESNRFTGSLYIFQ